MRIVVFLIILMLCQAQAQTPADDAKATAKLVDQLYTASGTDVGSMFYESDILLCLGGRRVQTDSYETKLLEGVDQAGLNAICEPAGIRIFVQHERFYFQSRPALERLTAASKMDWMVPFDATGANWETFEEWKGQVKTKYKELGLDSSSDVWYFVRGLPDSVLRARREIKDDAVARHTSLNSSVRYGEFLAGEDPNFRIPVSVALADDCLARYEDWSLFLEAFYHLPEVRARLFSADFIAARKRLRPKIYDPHSEKWIRGEVTYGEFELDGHYGTSLMEERVLIAHADELAALLKQPLTDVEIGQIITRWGHEMEPPVWMDLGDVLSWIWTGGFGKYPQRTQAYEALKSTHPEILAKRTQQRLESWLKEKPRKEDANQILVLFSHSGVKELFATLPQEEKDKIRARLEAASFDGRVRILIGQPPYSL